MTKGDMGEKPVENYGQFQVVDGQNADLASSLSSLSTNEEISLYGQPNPFRVKAQGAGKTGKVLFLNACNITTIMQTKGDNCEATGSGRKADSCVT